MFRRYFESPSDAGQVIVVPPDEPMAGEPDAEQLIIDQINKVNADADAALTGGADQLSEPTVQGEGQAASDEQGQSAEDLILGRFKTKDDVITAYQNLEPEYTQTRQSMRELERQVQELQSQLEYTTEMQNEDDSFQFESPFTDQPRNVEELEQLAERAPDKAALFAIQNASRLPDELVQEVVNYWHTRNPAQATAYMLQQMMQGYVPQIEQRLQPHDNSRQEAIVTNAVNAAEKMIGPSYGEYHDRIVDTIEANPALLPSDVTDTQAMTQAIVNVYAMVVGMEQLQRGKQLAAQGAPPPAPQAQTQTRPTAGSNTPNGVPQEDIDAARQIQQLILNAQA